ncbi:MAG TPA: VanZ family protein [Pyrinomonadaceae bacterium]|jgi:VanZ family protein|nr:VanZ family protein [Pyrinomonadaceae bacterium]
MIEKEEPNRSRQTKTISHIARNRFSRYAPLLVWAALIFIGSGNVLSAEHTSILLAAVRWLFPSASEAFLASLHFVIRKAGHLIEYAILAILAARAFRYSFHAFIKSHWFAFALLVAAAYSLTDEFHQSFVPARTASIYDCMIDSAGALIGLIIIWFWYRGRPAEVAEHAMS